MKNLSQVTSHKLFLNIFLKTWGQNRGIYRVQYQRLISIILLFRHHFAVLWNAHSVWEPLLEGFLASAEFLAFPPSWSRLALASTLAATAMLSGFLLQHGLLRSFALKFVKLFLDLFIFELWNKMSNNSPLSSSNSFSKDWISSSRNFNTWPFLLKVLPFWNAINEKKSFFPRDYWTCWSTFIPHPCQSLCWLHSQSLMSSDIKEGLHKNI